MRITLRYLPGVMLMSLLMLASALPVAAQDSAEQERPGIADMVEQVTPAVVNISVTGRVSLPDNPLYNDPFFRRFFGPPEQMPRERQTMSVGSGVIIDADQGYILTNHHVVANADQIRVRLRDRRDLEATLVGSDEGTDVALLKVEADNLTALPLSDSDSLRIGDYVVAIGNPFSIGQTVTSGIVSALSRSTGLLGQGQGFEDFIQTDASINPGNSGGALVDYNGRLVGINTAIIAPTGGNVGIGFAIPINMAMAVAEQLIEHGEFTRGLLGVMMQELTPDVARVLGIEVSRGAVVAQVMPDTAADRAGLQAGDVITGINGRQVDSMQDLRNTIALMRPGAEISLVIYREGERMEVDAELGEANVDMASAPSEVQESNVLQGATLGGTPPGGQQGVLVADVVQGSRAFNNGLRAGDIIIEVNRQPITNRQQLQEVLAQSPGTAAMRIIRDNQQLFLVMAN